MSSNYKIKMCSHTCLGVNTAYKDKANHNVQACGCNYQVCYLLVNTSAVGKSTSMWCELQKPAIFEVQPCCEGHFSCGFGMRRSGLDTKVDSGDAAKGASHSWVLLLLSSCASRPSQCKPIPRPTRPSQCRHRMKMGARFLQSMLVT